MSTSHTRSSLPATGLYGIPELSEAAGFQRITDEAILRTEELINNILTAPPGLETITLLDEISDTVCRVVDAAELCRNTHPQRPFVLAANDSYLKLHTYLAKLNSNLPLYDALAAAMHARTAAAGQPTSARDDEADRVGASLLHDFVRGGVHLPREQRDRVGELSAKVTRAEMTFSANLVDPSLSESFTVSRDVLAQMPSQLRARAGRGGVMRAEPLVERAVLRSVADEDTRRAAFLAAYSSPAQNLAALDDIVQGRYELARHLQAESHGHFVIPPLMAASPAAVDALLQQLSVALQEPAQAELDSLRRLKQSHTGRSRGGSGAALPDIRGWDRDYYMVMAKSSANLGNIVNEYLPLYRCIEGFCMLSERLFCTTLKPVALAPGETWAPNVQKLEACHATEGVLGHIYLDLSPREGKYNHAAMYTLRAGRALPHGGYQTALLALVCNFGSPLLSHHQMETLFHEFGHAMHSLLSRTHFQHLAGARGALDFVEVPSHLMEYFAWDATVLRMFAKHHTTDETMPPQLLHDLRAARAQFSAMEMQTQVVYAMYDQVCHSATPPARGGGTTVALAEVMSAHSAVKHEPGSAWQLRFGHLVPYSAAYYSYLYAKCVSASVWAELFAGDPLARGAGERLRLEVLRHGGTRCPATMLRHLLGEQALVTSSGGCYPAPGPALREMGL